VNFSQFARTAVRQKAHGFFAVRSNHFLASDLLPAEKLVQQITGAALFVGQFYQRRLEFARVGLAQRASHFQRQGAGEVTEVVFLRRVERAQSSAGRRHARGR